ncbi:MAG: hypothetical protein ACRDON_11850 [Gaiellaceae bacterium]
MTELEQALVRLGAEIVFPDTPDAAVSVRRRLVERPPRRGLRLLERRMLAIAFALLALAVGAAMAVPSARSAILEFFHLRGASVERVDTLPRVPNRLARVLELGNPVRIVDGRPRVKFPDLLVPEALGPPDSAYYSAVVPGGKVSLVYRPRDDLPRSRFTGVGVLITEFRGDLHPEFVDKLASQVTRIERLTVGRDPAVWLEGGPHVVFFDTPYGFAEDQARLAGNTLLVQHGNVLVRIEGNMSRERAVELAESLR